MGKYIITEHMTDLELLFVIGDNCTAVHFRTSAYHSKDTADRNNFTLHVLHTKIIFIPRIFLTMNGNRNRLCIITNGCRHRPQG